ncbi:MAG: hypothetical protein HOM21_03995, partial [Halobacteriovoraceae bacterium]|nr:hypothetical protein [Halobacteriovoraceae bacterium]
RSSSKSSSGSSSAAKTEGPKIFCYSTLGASEKQRAIGSSAGTHTSKIIKNEPLICKFPNNPEGRKRIRYFFSITRLESNASSCSKTVYKHSSISSVKKQHIESNKHCSFGNLSL